MRSFLLLVLAVVLVSASHEYYVSVFVLNYNEDDHRLEGTAKVFSDDLEKVLKEFMLEPFSMEDTIDNQLIHESLSGYLSKTFIFIDPKGAIQEVEYIGYEIDRDMAYIHFQFSRIDEFKGSEIKNKWFMDVFSDQVNILHFNGSAEKQSEYFTSDNTSIKFDFPK